METLLMTSHFNLFFISIRRKEKLEYHPGRRKSCLPGGLTVSECFPLAE